VLNINVLTQDEMAAIDERQARQQSQWKGGAASGQSVTFLGMELVVLPGVFPPKEDTALLAQHVPGIDAADVLDVGTGTGALAIWAAQQGAASVVAVDIAEAAVRNSKRNVESLGLEDRVDVRAGHVFASLAPTERFDIILANLPGRNKTAGDDTSAAQWDTGFRAHKALFAGAAAHLRPGGRIYMVKANYPDLHEMVGLAESEGYDVTIIAQSTLARDDPRRYYVLSLSNASWSDGQHNA